jgi:hypothetical protein
MATVTCLRTNQNPRIDWQCGALPINSWVLCQKNESIALQTFHFLGD